ncbi:MAG: flavin reductase family protein [Anaerolineae bacterium]|jgi:flavin reductase (DIM6/NTAB) family NADH-FMN oxidoreductase RutF|nr:flavin reductase family protein [Anaerolineae bacterium]
MAIDAALFRQSLSQWASGVTVVTLAHGGEYHGMTASSFSSVSLTPPLILVCIAHHAATHARLMETGAFAVNILAEHQADLGKRFAGMMPDITDRFADLTITTAETGSPLLDGVLAALDCRTHQTVEAGDHTILIGEIVAAHVNPGEPLIYSNRRWGGFRQGE